MSKKNEYQKRNAPFWMMDCPEKKRIWYINEARRKREFESRACSKKRSSRKEASADD
ncbi:MAG: hypothetical protein WC153_04615 [Candidatus Methanomethylophilaceae archaeon]